MNFSWEIFLRLAHRLRYTEALGGHRIRETGFDGDHRPSEESWFISEVIALPLITLPSKRFWHQVPHVNGSALNYLLELSVGQIKNAWLSEPGVFLLRIRF